MRLQTDLGGGVGAAEADDVLQSDLGVLLIGREGEALAAAELGPEDGQAQPGGGNAAPGQEEVAMVFRLAGIRISLELCPMLPYNA